MPALCVATVVWIFVGWLFGPTIPSVVFILLMTIGWSFLIIKWKKHRRIEINRRGVPEGELIIENNFPGTIENNFPRPIENIFPGPIAFTYEDLANMTNGFSHTNLLGEGGYGYVHKGVLSDGKEVAVKQLKAGSRQGDREFRAEVETISRIHHRHLVTLVGHCVSASHRILVYEFVPNNTLQFHLQGQGVPTLSWNTRMNIALGAARALTYLHEDCHPKIVHRDIKSTNILLDRDFQAKVADFGMARFFRDTETHVTTRVVGTFGYMAPEYASSGRLTEKSDVFSFGVVILELITGRPPIIPGAQPSGNGISLADWARDRLTRAMEDNDFRALADPRLEGYDSSEMARMVACAAASIRSSAPRRPKMSLIVRALEGSIALHGLNTDVPPGHSSSDSPLASSNYHSAPSHDCAISIVRRI